MLAVSFFFFFFILFVFFFVFSWSQIKHKLSALSGLKSKLEEMQTYLMNVLDGKLPVNNQVSYWLPTTATAVFLVLCCQDRKTPAGSYLQA